MSPMGEVGRSSADEWPHDAERTSVCGAGSLEGLVCGWASGRREVAERWGSASLRGLAGLGLFRGAYGGRRVDGGKEFAVVVSLEKWSLWGRWGVRAAGKRHQDE